MLFPARAGVIPTEAIFTVALGSFPRACGGDPSYQPQAQVPQAFSPRVRG